MKTLIPGIVFSFLAITLIVGCGKGTPKTVPVQGSIFVDGKPADSGRVNFYPIDGRRSSTGRIVEGKYIMTTFDGGDGVLPGKHKVTIKVVKKLKPDEDIPVPAKGASAVEIENYIEQKARAAKKANMIGFVFPKILADKSTTTIEVDIQGTEPVIIDYDSADFE